MLTNELQIRIDTEVARFSWISSIEMQWFAQHRVEPRSILLAADDEGNDKVECLLLTDHTGANDSSYRVIYNPVQAQFGRELELENGTSLLLGYYPDLEHTLDEIF